MTTYRFSLVCPRCDKTSETTSDKREPAPRVSCGDCLMDHTEIVHMTVDKVDEVGAAPFQYDAATMFPFARDPRRTTE